MKLAILNWRDEGHPEAGGAENYCHAVAARLVTAGHMVTYVTARHPGSHRRSLHPDGYRVVRAGGRYSVYPGVLWWLLRHRWTLDGVIDSQNGIPFFSPVALRRRTPVVLLVHHVHQEQFALYFGRAMSALGRWLESTAARHVYGTRAIAAVSPSTRSAVRRRLRLRGSIRLTPCGLDPSVDAPRARSKETTIVMLGRLVPHKRVHLMIEAMPEVLREHPSTVLHVIGDGSERERLLALAAELGVSGRVVLHGRVSDVRRDEVLRSSWLMVNPTAGEGWGLSVLEANRLGLPALAFRVDGVRDSVVHGVTGWLADQDADLGAAVSAALSELQDERAARQRESSARAWAAAFTWEATAATLLSLIEGEARRLARVVEHRSTSDLMTVVEIDAAAVVPRNWEPQLRAGDVIVRGAGGVRVLLLGIGHAEVPALLERTGLDRDLLQRGSVTVSVAGHQESLMLAAGISEAGIGGVIKTTTAGSVAG